MTTQAKEKCPLCTEEMDLTDKQLKPCKCGYEDIIIKDLTSILKELCADKSNFQKEQAKSQKQKPVKVQSGVTEESIDPYSVRVIQRRLVYIVGMPSEFASDKVLRQHNFLGQYGKIESIIIDNIGANQQIPDSGRVYVTFSREEEAFRCIEAVNGFILDGRPLKATFGVTRYCHVWLSNKIRLQHLLGMDTKGLRSGNTLPPPGDCVSRTTVCNGNSKDKTCSDDYGVLHNHGNKNLGTLPATTLQEEKKRNSTPNNQQGLSASVSQELPPLGPKVHHLNDQLASCGDKPQASVQSANGNLNSKQVTAAGNGTVGTLSAKQYVNVVSQGSSGSGRRFTVLTRQTASSDTRSKATGQVGNASSDSQKLTSANNEHSDRIKISRSDNVKLVSQRPEEPSQMLANHLTGAIDKTHVDTDEKNARSDINEKTVCGIQMQLKESTAAHRSTVLQSLRDNPMSNNLPTLDVKSQISVVPDKPSDSQSASKTQLQPSNHKKTAVCSSDTANASDACGIANNQVLFPGGKHQTSSQGEDHSLYKRDKSQSGDQLSSQHPGNVFSPRLLTSLSSIDITAKENKGIKRHVCPPGFEELHRPSDSDKITSVSSPTSSIMCSGPDTLVQDSCSAKDQPDFISWVSECLEDGGETTQSNRSIPSTLSSTDATWRYMQYPASCFSGASNHFLVSPYPRGLSQHTVGRIENTMNCCCSHPSVSGIANHKPEYWSGSDHSYMSTGGYDVFSQSATLGMIAGMVGTSPQQPSPPVHYNDWTTGSADSDLKSPQVDHTYPMYSLF
ncbi:hypothetical protein OsJ_00836 [Oryza sativa Japonica Group]|uniref:RRM domain-containing protein n=1 Tax=Oryza sativa subsp. japonica TaxID=39947 RepID=B9EU12_ORYSJ|nr:hypothetical protein OsJ_00836 [Oryza sativa Japonica Group]